MQLFLRIITAGIFLAAFSFTTLHAQVTDSSKQTSVDTTKPLSVDPELENVLTSKVPKEYTIAGIAVSGAKFLDSSLLLNVSGLTIGDQIMLPGSDNLSKAVSNLWKQNLFNNVKIYLVRLEGKNLFLEIDVQERPRLSNFYFKGIRKGEAEDLDTKSGLVRSRVITENMKLTAIENIQKFYTEKGYQSADVKVVDKMDPGAKNFETLTFYIIKGKKVRINQINFFGDSAISEARLKKQLKGTKEMSRLTLYPSGMEAAFGKVHRQTFKEYVHDYGFLSLSKTKEYLDPYFRFKLFASAKFNQTKFDDDKQKVLDYYNSQGYRDATLVKDTQYYTTKGDLNIDLKVDEGRKYYFGNIAWKGNTKYSDSALSTVLGIQKGDVYNLELMNKRLGNQASAEGGGDVKGLYMDYGYLFFSITPVETRVYNDTIDYEIRMTEGPPATIKNVTIAGNEKTKEHVIRRELRTIPGEVFSREAVIRTNRELSQLGYFNQEKIQPDIVPNQADGTVDINWTVEEKSSDQLELSAGWGGGIGLTGTLGVTFNNFSLNNIFHKKAWDPLPSGDGQKLSARIQANGRSYRSYSFSFTEPWLGGKKRNSLTVSIYNTRYSNSTQYNSSTGQYETNKSDTSHLNIFGLGVAMGKQLKWPDDYFTLTYGLNYTQYTLHSYPGYFTNLSTGRSRNINVKVTLARNSVNSPIYPTSGSGFSLSVQATPPYSMFRDPNDYTKATDKYKFVEYHKWRFNSEWYVPIGQGGGSDHSRQFVLKAAAKFGYIGRYKTSLEVSPFERFQLGDAGISNTYGFLGYDIIAQRGYPVYNSSNPTVNPDNGSSSANPGELFTIFNKYVLEMRYPFTTNPSSTIYGLTFFEAANGWYDFQHYNPFQLRRSVGVGMRFFLPMFGLLGFDYGVGLDRIQQGQGLKGASRFTFMLGYEPE